LAGPRAGLPAYLPQACLLDAREPSTMTRILLVALLILPLAANAATPPITTQLPRNVRPTHYEIALTPDAQAMTFDGKVTISIDVLEPTAAITLNAIDLAFASADVTDSKGRSSFGAVSIALSEAHQTATFTLQKPLPKGHYRLALSYRGKIGTQLVGLFAIDYDTAQGSRRALYTQLEAADARRFIPCWDEPNYKATFTLEAIVPAGQRALSNMPVAQQTDLGDGHQRVRFAESPKMSTYLLFFGTGEFDRITTHEGNTEIGVVTKKDSAPQAAFALESSRAVLHEYNDYFGVPYPLPKLDNIASPGSSQFFSAMENWGAIYTFENSILLDPSIATQADKQYAFNVLAHEMAHQWFGDLVTMSWWDDLWLNESFASWMSSRTAARLHPEWDTALDAVAKREHAMKSDALVTTHPVVQRITSVEQATQAFDAITYTKGEAVIRMLESYVGDDAWRTGLRRYIRKFSYGNTVSDDLWHEIATAARAPVMAIARDFTLQPGIPLIRVGAAICTTGHTTLQLTQGEFSRDRPDKKPLTWRVPVIVESLEATQPVRAVVSDGKATVTVPGCGPIIVNAGQSGYFVTQYSPTQFAQIRDSFTKLAAIDQLGILSDTWSMTFSGAEPVSNALDLTATTPGQANPKIWSNIASYLGSVNNYYTSEDVVRRDRFRAFAITTLESVFSNVGWTARPNESDSVALLREELIDTLSALGDHSIIIEAQRRYRASKTDPTAIPAALRTTLLGVVARHADAATWDQLHAEARAERTPLVKDHLYVLLSTTEDETLARHALELALTSEPDLNNSASMIAGVAQLHPDLALDFALDHKDAVDARVDASGHARFYPSLGASSLNAATAEKIEAYAAQLAPDTRRNANVAIATINYRIKVRNERLPDIDAWLSSHGY
jgi:puromycin-sensitive aminopeptidase